MSFFQRLDNANPRTYHKPMLHYPHIRHHPLNVIAMKISINLQQNLAKIISCNRYWPKRYLNNANWIWDVFVMKVKNYIWNKSLDLTDSICEENQMKNSLITEKLICRSSLQIFKRFHFSDGLRAVVPCWYQSLESDIFSPYRRLWVQSYQIYE